MTDVGGSGTDQPIGGAPPGGVPRFEPPQGPVWPGPPPYAGEVPQSPGDPYEPPRVPTAPTTGIAAGIIVGLGILMTLTGLFSAYKVWSSVNDLYSFDDAGFSGGSPLSGSGGGLVDLQRYSSLDGALVVVGLGLLVVAAGLVLRRLDRRP